MSKTITAILATGILTAPLICTLVGLAIGFAFGRRRSRTLAFDRSRPHTLAFGRSRSHTLSFQNHGEARLSREIRTHFIAPNYHLMNHITLQVQDGTTQVDHILVSRFGVFVIETKDYKGWIFANGKHAKWTQVLFKWKFQFQNPIFQNFRHVRAVQELLDFLPADCIKSVVVFTGDAEFKTEVPPGVFGLSEFVDHITEQTTEIMSLNRMQFCVGRLEAARLAITNETDVEHVENLKRKHGIAA
ncbi:Nuclease-related domain-containing protein [Cupriavidus sp. YR651]|uniref:nuclease-related domain-containing protein n=1 Tax=Cupriavidus sp. YR651 TaxID=1855315 RepID=UPI0008862F18|nr:nuclease-related domain-containing protein [Cupriavidus sp. YR651]SDC83919.1 Nuclease-related domain-containing protein [Cupriavidus sp. YR651]